MAKSICIILLALLLPRLAAACDTTRLANYLQMSDEDFAVILLQDDGIGLQQVLEHTTQGYACSGSNVGIRVLSKIARAIQPDGTLADLYLRFVYDMYRTNPCRFLSGLQNLQEQPLKRKTIKLPEYLLFGLEINMDNEQQKQHLETLKATCAQHPDAQKTLDYLLHMYRKRHP